jgi:hypothetical protein
MIRRIRSLADSAAQSVPRQYLADSMCFIQELCDICCLQDAGRIVDCRWIDHTWCARRHVGTRRAGICRCVPCLVIGRWLGRRRYRRCVRRGTLVAAMDLLDTTHSWVGLCSSCIWYAIQRPDPRSCLIARPSDDARAEKTPTSMVRMRSEVVTIFWR